MTKVTNLLCCKVTGNRTDMPIVLSVTTMEKVSLKQKSVALFSFE